MREGSEPGGVPACYVTGDSDTVPRGDDWLTAAEAAVQETLTVVKRRDDWRLGRWLAKRAIRAAGSPAGPARIEIIAGPDGAPLATIGEAAESSPSISISHSTGTGMAAATFSPVRLGCDVEAVQPRSERLVADHFTPAEREVFERFPAGDRALLVNLFWSAKESALKVLREGMRLDTRTVEVSYPGDGGATPIEALSMLSVRLPGGDRLACHWWLEGGFVWTLAGSEALAPVRVAL